MAKKGRRNRTKGQGSGNPRSGHQRASNTANRPSQQAPESSRTAPPHILEKTSDELLDCILARGVDERFNSRETLRAHLLDICSSDRLQWLMMPLLDGIFEGPPTINARIACPYSPPETEPFPLLIWVCQWRFLMSPFGWKGGDEMVDIALKAGADANALLRNKTNAMSFAVKYGSLRTVDLLLNAGINIQLKNEFGQSCLYNALEHPQPQIIERLLEYLPVSEMFESSFADGRSAPPISLADRVLSLLTERSISWHHCGPPSASAVCETLMILRQRGAKFTAGSELSLKLLGMFFTNSPNIRMDRLQGVEVFKEVAKMLVGASIPEQFRPPPVEEPEVVEGFHLQSDDDKTSLEDPCPICLDPMKKRSTLYCSHSFCRDCIFNHGKQESGSTCPICRKPLCSDLHNFGVDNRMDASQLNPEQLMGVTFDPMHCGPAFMSDEQVSAESKFQGVYSMFSSYSTLRSKLEQGRNRGHELYIQNGVKMNLASDVTVTDGTTLSLSPGKGPGCIEVSVRNVPLLARISNHSIYTMVGASTVKSLGLRRIEHLQSRKFVDILTGKKVRNLTFTCLEPFKIKIGEIEVTLRNAIEASPDPTSEMFGIQLGQDFLLSGVWCPIDVAFQDNALVRVDGEVTWLLGAGKLKGELLRYYSDDGKIAHVPLLHFSPFVRTVMGVSLKMNVKFDQCYWCRRVFPEGMVFCADCYHDLGKRVTYCHERCQRAALRVHRKHHQ